MDLQHCGPGDEPLLAGASRRVAVAGENERHSPGAGNRSARANLSSSAAGREISIAARRHRRRSGWNGRCRRHRRTGQVRAARCRRVPARSTCWRARPPRGPLPARSRSPCGNHRCRHRGAGFPAQARDAGRTQPSACSVCGLEPGARVSESTVLTIGAIAEFGSSVAAANLSMSLTRRTEVRPPPGEDRQVPWLGRAEVRIEDRGANPQRLCPCRQRDRGCRSCQAGR